MNKFFWNAERQAEVIVHRMRSFRSTPDYPSPSYLPFGQEYDDIAGVLAGVKPAACIIIFEWDRALRNPILYAMLRMALRRRFTILSPRKNCVVVGIRENVLEIHRRVKRLVDHKHENIEEQIEHSTRMGQLLGYSQEAIDDMNYGIINDLNFWQRETRRKLLKAS